ncbi:pyrimidine/purine nucleoside phosphorylase [Marinobacterium marinum]|uniref:Pyrimidine/purine nucleoside phosphorylase n=1 Tax=Marinobacterium marinum TaxID=2756129 RepID=A0A7W1X038_9GAMM|nr:pyrimidine/purine nucleoside phosphorylase [Marinobacterium marinum]MBA4503314.1 pyrimidine/purine nucleoside phosphorylase [Marinobacterium marinum]
MLSTNSYFDGNVASIAFETPQGPATSGVMLPGEYTFGTSQNERMIVTSGLLTVRLPGQTEWTDFTAGTEFNITAGDAFDVRLDTPVTYLCYYS